MGEACKNQTMHLILSQFIFIPLEVQLSETAYRMTLGKLNNYKFSILCKPDTRGSWKASQVFFRI